MRGADSLSCKRPRAPHEEVVEVDRPQEEEGMDEFARDGGDGALLREALDE